MAREGLGLRPAEPGRRFMRRRRSMQHPIHHEDPMSMMGNLFDIARSSALGC
jgi:hypothetical protein